ncbi:MAG TPA: DPP IV N-terminal domain-containing protein, partial [Chitinophagaceae bacterium]|nr:DPP IV N-terminal domain-containing protein [Chitinophagaceae bacterium]
MKKCLLTLLFLPFYLFSFSQDKILTLEDAMLRARTTLAPENLAQLQFFENSNDYVFLKKQNGQDIWMRGNYKLAGNEWPFLTLPGLNRFMEEAGSDTFKTMPVIRFGTDGWIMNNKGNKIRYNPITKKITLLLSKELAAMENAEESTTGFTAYLDKHNLFVSNPDKQIYQVTTDGSKDIVYASSVHRDEFGISKGIFWSTKGTKLAFYRMDQSMVNDYPIINWSERPARAELIKYPMAGDKSHHVRVGVFNTATESTIWLKTGIPVEQYLTNIAWSPDDKYVFIAVLNREQNHLKLNQYDATTGDFVKTLFEEQDEKYVEPLVPMHFLKNNPGQFIWQSNRDGWNQLYLYDINGKLIRQLTKGNWEVLDVKGFDSKGENLFFVSTILSAVNKNLCSVNLKTGKTNLLTPLPGVHAAQVSVDGSTVLDVYSTIDNPRTIQLIEVKKPAKNPAKLLLQAANPLKEFSAVSLSLFTLKNKKGDSLFCRQFNPVGFSPDKK